MKWFLLAIAWLWTGAVLTVLAQPGSADGLLYHSGWSVMVRSGMDLHHTLPPKYQALIHSRPINMETDLTPLVRLEELMLTNASHPVGTLFVSIGFVDLVNYVAHAKAIDRIEKGYFERYIIQLAEESGEKELRPPAQLEDPRYWTLDVMNAQLSYFNQIAAHVGALHLAHFYLGHYQNHLDELRDAQGKAVPINRLLTLREWEAAMKCGANNALDCGIGVDGIIALYEAIDKMPRRPAWTLFFLPEKARFITVKNTLKKCEKNFFRRQ